VAEAGGFLAAVVLVTLLLVRGRGRGGRKLMVFSCSVALPPGFRRLRDRS
jgi:hypothetical protein